MMGDKGFALIMTLFFILFTGIIMTVIVPAGYIQQNLTHNIAGSKKAEYAAEAGIVYAEFTLTEDRFSVPFGEKIHLTSDLYFTIKITIEKGSYFIMSEGVFKDQKVYLYKKKKSKSR